MDGAFFFSGGNQRTHVILMLHVELMVFAGY